MRRKGRLLALRCVMFEPQTLMEAVRCLRLWPCLHSSPGVLARDIGDTACPVKVISLLAEA